MMVAPEIFYFDRWQLDLRRRTLCADGAQVPLQGRAFDLLSLLVAHAGQPVSTDQIMASVWEGRTVTPGNVTVQILNIRNALGGETDGGKLIVNVTGRGYKFVGDLVAPPKLATTPAATEPIPPTALVATPAPIIRTQVWRLQALAIAAVLIVLLGVGTIFWSITPSAPRLSIAVLPFRNFSPDHAQDYLADALTDDLTTDLAHIPASTVIARESADVWRGKAVNVQQIGRALMVRYLLEGSLRAEDGKYHVNVQLIDAASGAHLWANRFDTEQGGLSEVREAIVRRLATSLDFQLTQIERDRSLRDRPNDPDALDLFFRARAITDWDDSLPGLTRAQALLEQAILKQPDFGDALSELGALLVRKLLSMDDPEDDTDIVKARRAIAHALLVNPHNPQALATQGRLFADANRFDAAKSSAREALAIDNSNVQAETVLAICAHQEGKLNEAEAHYQAALRLTPSSPMNKTRLTDLGYVLLMENRVQDAIEALDQALGGDNSSKPTENLGRMEIVKLLLVAATFLQGNIEKSKIMYTDYDVLWPHRTVWRFAALTSRADSKLVSFQHLLGALQGAGMAPTADERSSPRRFGSKCEGGEFAIPPNDIQGGKVFYTSDVVRHLHESPHPLIIDLGRGVVSPIDAVWYDVDTSEETSEEFTIRVALERSGGSRQNPIIVLGAGYYGCDAYIAASQLIDMGYSNVAWYRGGEEAWAANRQPFVDRRPKAIP